MSATLSPDRPPPGCPTSWATRTRPWRFPSPPTTRPRAGDAGPPPHRRAGGARAVLHVHGFADYFFQTGLAEWWDARGYDFYAVDLRKYGRSWLPHQTPTYVDDLATYAEDLDAALAVITARPRPRGAQRSTRRADSPCRCGGTIGATRPSSGACSTRRGWTCAAPGCCAPSHAGDRRVGAAADARARAGGLRQLRAQPAPRPRRRVGLRPALEAAEELADAVRLAARRPAGAPAGARRVSTSPGRCWCSARTAPAPTPRWARRSSRPTSSSTSSRSGAGRARWAGTSRSSRCPRRCTTSTSRGGPPATGCTTSSGAGSRRTSTRRQRAPYHGLGSGDMNRVVLLSSGASASARSPGPARAGREDRRPGLHRPTRSSGYIDPHVRLPRDRAGRAHPRLARPRPTRHARGRGHDRRRRHRGRGSSAATTARCPAARAPSPPAWPARRW